MPTFLEKICGIIDGHLSMKNLQKLTCDKLVKDFDFSITKEIQFCESCIAGKQHKNSYPSHAQRRSKEALELIHSDVCGKINAKSLSGGEYFLIFTDDKSRYVWVYIIKNKSEVFDKFCEWKRFVEKSTGKSVKALRTDNGGEYTSHEFKKYLLSQGIKHEFTVSKCPQQNGVAECLNRTLKWFVVC
uniref:Integrase catalytic domain-containing protein n=1 Tax=Amphimedon queenslandica TaxID=400682 RepID=A0A1X7TBC3_AMPQE